MNNGWNKVIYKMWSPFYDKFFNTGVFLEARKTIFRDPIFQEGSKVLFVGVGTGADLELVHQKGLEITVIDSSPDMLEKAKQKFVPDTSIAFMEMDAQNLQFPDNVFDIVVASLIVTVVPDPNQSMKEMIRVTRTGGQILIFDKFLAQHEELSVFKRMIRPFVAFMGTDIGLHFETLIEPYRGQISVLEDVPLFSRWNVRYRKIKIKKEKLS